MSTHDSNPPSETTEPCYWCSRISLDRKAQRQPLDQIDRKFLQKFFHSDCECRRMENAPPSTACGFCKHLNIRHLVRYALIHDDLDDYKFFTDWYCRENPHEGCPLCKFIASFGAREPEIGFEFWKKEGDSYCTLMLEGTENEEDWICLSQDSTPRFQNNVDWKKIKEWLSKTESEDETDMEEDDLPDDFRVIDVERKCIVTPDYPVNYVALSYVWGESPPGNEPFQAKARNIEDLEIKGSLSKAPLPRTITDAMEACRKLGREYLWIDRLCIIQDDESKHGQINHMDSIFGSSEFTIIAQSGKHTDDGLPRVSKPRESSRLKTIEWQGITLTKFSPDIRDLVQSSYWAKRGWTFQEEFCSRNNLYFTEYGVYYSDSYGGEPNAECPAAIWDIPTQMFEFPESVEAYATRSFTDPGDFLRALTGVLNMEFDAHRFGNGTPISYGVQAKFYVWIHWQPVNWEYEARQPPKDISTGLVSHVQPHKSDVFPSWSWTITQGGIHFDPHVDPVALWAFPAAQDFQEDDDVEWVSDRGDACRLRKITVETGLMSARQFPFQLTNDSGRIPASLALFEKADRDEACKKLGRILSFTQIASLRLKGLDDRFFDGRRTFHITSSTGECIGGIWLPKLSFQYVFNKEGSLKENEFEFMALSTHRVCRSREKRMLESFGLENSVSQTALNVMLIWRANDSNVARRLGMGQVFQDSWFKEGPVLKTIILE